MSDDEFTDYDDEPTDQRPKPNDANLAKLRAKAEEADRLRVENEELRRERAFDKAKLPEDVPGINFFRENYKGDLSPEAILEAAATHGFVRPNAEADTSTADRDAQQRMTAAAAGVSAPQQPDWQAGMRAAAEAAPPGQQAQAIADYMQSIGRSVVS